MKLALVLLTLTSWFVTAKAIQRNTNSASWQTRCLGCGHTAPATSAHIIRHAQDKKKHYALSECSNCEKLAGFVIEERKAVSAES